MLIEIGDETVFLILAYRTPDPVESFIQDLIAILVEFPTEYRPLVVGDYNLDQLFYENILMLNGLQQPFHCHQQSHFTKHIHGGILDLVFDSGRSDPVA